MTIGKSRREAICFLIGKYDTQTDFAGVLKHETLTQPILSSIVRGTRPLHEYEARDVEQILGIPDGWLDKERWVLEGWDLIREYRTLGVKEKSIADRMVAFALGR